MKHWLVQPGTFLHRHRVTAFLIPSQWVGHVRS